MIRTNKYPVPNYIVPRHVLVSTFYKEGLHILVDCVLRANPDAMFYATGGTEDMLRALLKSREATHCTSVEAFTGAPEMEGGLVKTLHPKIFAGLLAERNNPEHEAYLATEMAKFGQGPGVYFDVFVGNLYPFEEIVRKEGGSAEVARCYIDIGGPSMTMAAAKNWHSVTAITGPSQYTLLNQVLENNRGRIPATWRFEFACQAMKVIADFRIENCNHFNLLDFERHVLPTIQLAE